MNLTRFFLAAAIGLGGSACEGISFDLDAVELGTVDVDSGADAQNNGDTDMGMPSDGGTDMTPPTDGGGGGADTGQDAGEDMPPDMPIDMGPECEIPHPIDTERCNPTTLGLCPDDGYCVLAFVGAPPPALVCTGGPVVPNCGDGTLDTAADEACDDGNLIPGDGCDDACQIEVGYDCNGNDCEEGATCVNWGQSEPDPLGRVCSKFCEIDTNKGCDEGEFCTSNAALPPMDGIGVCRAECDPYDPNACGAGATCNVDYNFPTSTCLPRFRCVEANGFKMIGEDCGPTAVGVSSCSEGLLCYEVDIADFRCVEPCQADGDCTSGECLDPSGTHGLQHCSLP